MVTHEELDKVKKELNLGDLEMNDKLHTYLKCVFETKNRYIASYNNHYGTHLNALTHLAIRKCEHLFPVDPHTSP